MEAVERSLPPHGPSFTHLLTRPQALNLKLPTKRTLASRIARNYDSKRAAKKALAQSIALRATLNGRLKDLKRVYEELGESTYITMNDPLAEGIDSNSARALIDGLQLEIREYMIELETLLSGET